MSLVQLSRRFQALGSIKSNKFKTFQVAISSKLVPVAHIRGYVKIPHSRMTNKCWETLVA